VLRSGSKKAAILTLLLDAFKGWLPVFVVQHWGGQWGLGATDVALVGLAAFLGHLYPVFFRFKGGKGVATAAGVLIGFGPLLGLLVLAIWLVVAFVFRYSSLAALVAAMAAPLVYMLGINGWWKVEGPVLMAVVLMSMLLLWRHRENIRRLLAGEEGRIGSKK
jgi:glycerol-3-phosphate acyltransferase PlsY